jgi:hypothetical protein
MKLVLPSNIFYFLYPADEVESFSKSGNKLTVNTASYPRRLIFNSILIPMEFHTDKTFPKKITPLCSVSLP